MNKNKKYVTIGLAGDTMLGRTVNEVITLKGYTYPWGNMIPVLKSTNINLVNLETTLTHHTKPVPKVFNFRADPDKVQCLKEARIDVVNIANNHILDFGPEGLLETLKILRKAGITYVGAGQNDKEASSPVILSKNGINVGILGFTDNEPDWKAGAYKPGTNYIHVGDLETIKKAVSALRSHVDLIILSIHWGPNMRERPTADFINFAHGIINCGVDILHGHSAHVPQGIEIYKKKLILYDTGDFVDDYAIDQHLRNDQSCFFIVTIDKMGIIQVKLIPTIIENMQVNRAEGEQYTTIIDHIKKLSAPYGTIIDADGTIVIK